MRDLGPVAAWKRRSFELLRPRPGARVLDLGCGTGEDLLELAELVAPGGEVVGIDASDAMVREARRRAAGAGARIEVLEGDVRRLDLPDGSFDGVRAERVLQHLADPGAAVAEMARVTRPGGWVVAADGDWGTLVVDAPDEDAGVEIARAAAARVRHGTVGRALRRLFLDAGLAEVEVLARTLVVADAERAEMLFGLAGAARRAADEGRLDPERARAWLAGVRAAGARGRLLVAMTSFMACGARPAR